MPFLDIHTHKRKQNEAIEVINFDFQTSNIEALSCDNLYSTGIHPWKIETNCHKTYFEKLLLSANLENVILIGETGLDKFAEASFEMQEEVFRTHVKVSEELRKPLIIHCVRYFNEIIRLKNELQPQMPWIIHGFNNKIEIAQQLTKHSIYLSFGKVLFADNSNAVEVLREIPLESLFLETDDSDYNIKEVYEKAAEILMSDTEKLSVELLKNFEKILEKTDYKLCIQGQNCSLEKRD